MKVKARLRRVAAFLILAGAVPAHSAVPATLTYQGRLKESGLPVTGLRNIEIDLCDALSGPSCYNGIPQLINVNNGLFRMVFTVPTGVALETGSWYLELSVNGQPFSPREALTSTAYAIYASSASTLFAAPGAASVLISTPIVISGQDAAGYTLTLSSGISAPQGTVTAKYFVGNGAGITGLSSLDGTKVQRTGDTMSGTLTMFGAGIVLSGTAGTINGVSSVTASAFFGDGSHLTGVTSPGGVLKTGDTMTGQLTNTSTVTILGPAFSVGGSTFAVASGSVGVGTAFPGRVLDVNGTGRFSGNVQLDNSTMTVNGPIFSTGTKGGSPFIGGGTRFMWMPSSGAFRAGVVTGNQWDPSNIGARSTAFGEDSQASGPYATVSGGLGNQATSNFGTVGGGDANVNAGFASTIGGGLQNSSAGNYSVVPGGSGNSAAAPYTFAAGVLAHANALGSFVWADSAGGGSGVELDNNVADSFLVRAMGGFSIHSSSFVFTTGVSTVVYIDNSGLAMAPGSSVTLSGSGGWIITGSSINASAFFGDGSHLLNVNAASAAGAVAKTGDTMTGDLTLTGAVLSVTSPGGAASPLFVSSSTTLGTVGLLVDPFNHVAIGKQVPTAMLHVGPNDDVDSVRIDGPTGLGTGKSVLSIGGRGDFGIDRPGTPNGRFVVKESGAVGIGVVNPDANSVLDASGAIYQRPSNVSSTAGYMKTNAANFQNSTQLNPGLLLSDAGGNVFGLDKGYNTAAGRYRTRLFAPIVGAFDLSFAVAAANPTSQTDFVDLMTIRGDSGRVGINTEAPAARLHVLSNFGEPVARFDTPDDSIVSVRSVDAVSERNVGVSFESYAIAQGSVKQQAVLQTIPGGNLTISMTNDGGQPLTERLRVSGVGFVGISTGAPATLLDVNGDASFGFGALKSTFSNSGALALANNASLTLSGQNGNITTGSSITASAFFGDGTNLTGVTATPGGAAGGDLAGTFPNPTLKLGAVHVWTAQQTFQGGADFSGGAAITAASGNLALNSIGGDIFLSNAGFTNLLIKNSGLIGVGSANPAGKFHMSSGTFILDGVTDGGIPTGPGTRFVWIPSSGSIRGGAVSGGQWDPANIGVKSVAFGLNNTAAGLLSVISGGDGNSTGGQNSAVGGGSGNAASGSYSTVSGGSSNAANQGFSTVGGGAGNIASNSYAVVPGGFSNTASGQYSFAAGNTAQSTANGAFTWADTNGGSALALANGVLDSFLVRAGGGVQFRTPLFSLASAATSYVIITSTGAQFNVPLYGDASHLTNGPSDGTRVLKTGDTMSGTLNINPGALNVTNGAIFSQGSVDNTAAITGPGTRFMWIPSSAAVRAGLVGNTEWNIIGAHSVAFGYNNNASADDTSVAGGSGNQATGQYASVGGGFGNNATGTYGTAAGGQNNTAGYSGSVGGGTNNTTAGGSYGTVPGGFNNTAAGDYSFAAGRGAVAAAGAAGSGSFVWADGTGLGLTSSSPNEFAVRAAGGVKLLTPGLSVANGSALFTVDSTSVDTKVPLYVTAAPGVNAASFQQPTDAQVVIRSVDGAVERNAGVSLEGFSSSQGGTRQMASIQAIPGGNLVVSMTGDGAAAATERFRIMAGGKVGVNNNNPGTQLDVNGDAQFGTGGSKSAFNTTGGLTMAGGAPINLSGTLGFITAQSSVNASAFFGDGSHLTGVISTSAVSKTGDTMSGSLFVNSATVTVSGPLIATGTYGGAGFFGAGTRFEWIPSSGAIRAGTVSGTQWNPIAIGGNSVAFGRNTTASGDASGVLAGEGNQTLGSYATVPGGLTNTISAVGTYSTIGGGAQNNITIDAATISGGLNNSVSGSYSAVGGGFTNNASGQYAMIPGGRSNIASGDTSFAGGYSAQAAARGAFTWADSNAGAGLALTNGVQDSWLARAMGGTQFKTSAFSVTNNATSMFLLDGTSAQFNVPLYGDGSHLTGVVAPGAVAKTGDTMTGNLNILASTISVAGPIISSGTSGGVVITGGGTRFEWIPSSAAIRAGAVALTNWDPLNIGPYSTAFGNNALATTEGATVGGGYNNVVQMAAKYGTVAGGEGNSVTGGSNDHGTVGGGYNNIEFMGFGTIAGGQNNQIFNVGAYGSVGGGYTNWVGGNSGVVPGGFQNQAMGNFSAVAGGTNNKTYGQAAFIAAGDSNQSTGDFSFAGGHASTAAHTGSFVWASGAAATGFVSAAVEEVAFRANGGVRFVTGTSTFSIASNGSLSVLGSTFVVQQSGSVGIGTNAPLAGYSLHVVPPNNGQANGIVIEKTGGNVIAGLVLKDTFKGRSWQIGGNNGNFPDGRLQIMDINASPIVRQNFYGNGDVGIGGADAQTTPAIFAKTNGFVGINNITPTLNLSFGLSSATIGIENQPGSVAGGSVTIRAGSAGPGANFPGGSVVLQAGAGTGTSNADGGNVILSAGAMGSAGKPGTIVLAPGSGPGIVGSVLFDGSAAGAVHLKAIQSPASVSAFDNANCGAGSSEVLSNGANDTAGVITLTTGTGSTSGCIVTVNFSKPYSNGTGVPLKLVLTSANGNSGSAQFFGVPPMGPNSASFAIQFNLAPNPSAPYMWTYFIIE